MKSYKLIYFMICLFHLGLYGMEMGKQCRKDYNWALAHSWMMRQKIYELRQGLKHCSGDFEKLLLELEAKIFFLDFQIMTLQEHEEMETKNNKERMDSLQDVYVQAQNLVKKTEDFLAEQKEQSS